MTLLGMIHSSFRGQALLINAVLLESSTKIQLLFCIILPIFEKLPFRVYNNRFFMTLGHESVSDLIKQFYAIHFYRCNIVLETLNHKRL